MTIIITRRGPIHITFHNDIIMGREEEKAKGPIGYREIRYHYDDLKG